MTIANPMVFAINEIYKNRQLADKFMPDHLLHSYQFDGKGGCVQVSNINFQDDSNSHNPIWIHLEADHPETKSWFESNAPFLDSFVVDALLAEETRPRMVQIDDAILLNLRGVNLNDIDDPQDMVSIRLWMDEGRIISVRRRKLKAVQEVVDKLGNGIGPKSSSEFLCTLVSLLFDRMSVTISALDDRTDNIESELLEASTSQQRADIVNIRKQAIMFRRYIAPQRDAISQLRSADYIWISDSQRTRLQENLNEVTRFVEDLDAIRERAQIIKDELANMLADKLNRNMYVLSVIAAIFLPLGFLTGLLGINVGGIPGVDNNNAFWIFTGLLVLVVVLQIWIFKKFKWF
ncbi:MAG: zinc transporter [Parasphingorhabdus sp.]|jgi:zinc transporter